MFKKLSFRELCDSKLFGLHLFDNMFVTDCAKNRDTQGAGKYTYYRK